MNIRGFLSIFLVLSLSVFQVAFSFREAVDERSYTHAQKMNLGIVGHTLHMDDHNANYPLVTNPFYQSYKLSPGVESADDFFGSSSVLSADGNTIMIGALGEESLCGPNQGSAYVFSYTGSAWSQQVRLTASDGLICDLFGFSVALSSNGNTALVGAPQDDIDSNEDQGSVYVFVRSGTSWSQQAHLLASDGETDDRFGTSVALSADGNTALVGAYEDDVSGDVERGSAYVFVRNGETWAQQTHLTASDGESFDGFGISAALSADGNTALLGALWGGVGAYQDQGSAYVFVRSGTSWSQQAYLLASDGETDDRFGTSVALSADGITALVGATLDDVGTNEKQGSAYVFTRSGVVWSQQSQLVASDGAARNYFGNSIALCTDGNIALVGALWSTVDGTVGQGSAYVFARSGTGWSQEARLVASDGAAFDLFGSSVSLSLDAKIALVGASFDDVESHANLGSAYLFKQPLLFLPLVTK